MNPLWARIMPHAKNTLPCHKALVCRPYQLMWQNWWQTTEPAAGEGRNTTGPLAFCLHEALPTITGTQLGTFMSGPSLYRIFNSSPELHYLKCPKVNEVPDNPPMSEQEMRSGNSGAFFMDRKLAIKSLQLSFFPQMVAD